MLRNRVRARLVGTVPISIAVHLVALVVLVIIPLGANIAMPLPYEAIPNFVRAEPTPPLPDVPVRVRTGRAPAAARTDAAPTSAPPVIVAEPPATASIPDVRANTGNGAPASFGITVDAHTPPPPPEPPRRTGPIRAASLPVAPVKIADAQPVYPDVARAARVEGTVVLECVIDTSGRVTNIRVLSSVPLLDQAAIDAVRRWRYTPSVYHGRPVSVLMTVTVRFTLH